MKIKGVKLIKLDEPKIFYDITVEKYHNFIIGDSKIVCHNYDYEDKFLLVF
jgi:intein/homing endonuclease